MKYPKHLPSYWLNKIMSVLVLIGIIGASVFAYMYFYGDLSVFQANAFEYDGFNLVQKVERAPKIPDYEDVDLSIDKFDSYKVEAPELSERVVRQELKLSDNRSLVAADTGDVDVVSGSLSYPYTKNFLVSAYYSPLPCQSRYATGSYEGDIRLNGSGVNGASGQGVYPGMIAAPKNYAFGTKLNIAGLGVGTVWDRGGAIVANGAGGYDRLDVWMGYGDVGLNRALNYGKRVVSVTVYGPDSGLPDSLKLGGYSEQEKLYSCDEVAAEQDFEEPDVKSAPETINTPQEPVKKVVTAVYGGLDQELGYGANGEAVRELQQELSNFNLYKGEISGRYDDLTAHAVFKFQQAHGIVASKSELGAGHFGPQTRQQMAQRLNGRETLVAKSSGSSHQYLVKELDPGITDPEVRKLQEFLMDKGYFNHPHLTNFFGPATFEAVFAYQLDRGVVTGANSLGAGRVGPGTLAQINSEI